MGTIIKAKCINCEFEKDFTFGGNKMDFTTNNPVPALHKKSGTFKNVNYFNTKLNNDFIYYFDGRLKGKNINGRTLQNFDFVLNENGNFCPNCKKFSMNFTLVTLTD